MKTVEKNIERVIFFSRWLQMPVYLGLVVAAILYAAKFMVQLWHLIRDFSVLNESTFMLSVLGLVDISMVIVFLLSAVQLAYTNKLMHSHESAGAHKPIETDKHVA